jgi:hypothetical protein
LSKAGEIQIRNKKKDEATEKGPSLQKLFKFPKEAMKKKENMKSNKRRKT